MAIDILKPVRPAELSEELRRFQETVKGNLRDTKALLAGRRPLTNRMYPEQFSGRTRR